jgi:hypothetical protein
VKTILAVLAGGLMIGAIAASHAKLPATPPKSDSQKSAEAEKAAAAKAKDAEQLNKAQDKAAANHKKGKAPAVEARKKAPEESKVGVKAQKGPGANHAGSTSPGHEPTKKEEATAMPLPGQANDHSNIARDPKQSSRR